MIGKSRFRKRSPGLKNSIGRPPTVSRPEAPSSVRLTRAPSGSFRTISCSVTALTVVAPGALHLGGSDVDHFDIEDPWRAGSPGRPPPRSGTFARMGIVLRPFDHRLRLGHCLQEGPRVRSIISIASLRAYPGARDYPQRGGVQWFSPSWPGGREKGRHRSTARRRSGFEHAPQQLQIIGDLAVLLGAVPLIRRTPCMTVVWSRPPNRRPDFRQAPRGELLWRDTWRPASAAAKVRTPLRADQVRKPGYCSGRPPCAGSLRR